MADHLEFYTGLRGFHVYSNTVTWRPYVMCDLETLCGTETYFQARARHRHDKFAVAGKTMVK